MAARSLLSWQFAYSRAEPLIQVPTVNRDGLDSRRLATGFAGVDPRRESDFNPDGRKMTFFANKNVRSIVKRKVA